MYEVVVVTNGPNTAPKVIATVDAIVVEGPGWEAVRQALTEAVRPVYESPGDDLYEWWLEARRVS